MEKPTEDKTLRIDIGRLLDQDIDELVKINRDAGYVVHYDEKKKVYFVNLFDPENK